MEDSVTHTHPGEDILEAAGYDVATAVDGRAAWELLQEHDVDLIVSECERRGMTGFELTARRCVRPPKPRGLPVVLVTALERDQGRRPRARSRGPRYLIKGRFDRAPGSETVAKLL